MTNVNQVIVWKNGLATTEEVLGQCFKVSLTINIPSFSLQVHSENTADKRIKEVDIPLPKKPLMKHRAAARAVLNQNGLSFDRGYLVPKERIDEVVAELKKIGNDFNQEKSLVPDLWHEAVKRMYDKYVAQGNQTMADKLWEAYRRQGFKEGLAASMNFGFSRYKIEHTSDGEFDSVESESSGLIWTLAKDVESLIKAKKDTNCSEEEGKGFTRSWRETFQMIQRKLEAMSFISEERVRPLITALEGIMPHLNTNTRLTKAQSLVVQSTVTLLENTTSIMKGAISASINIDENVFVREAAQPELPIAAEKANWGVELSGKAASQPAEVNAEAQDLDPDTLSPDDLESALFNQTETAAQKEVATEVETSVSVEEAITQAVIEDVPSKTTPVDLSQFYVEQPLTVSNW